MHKSPLEDISDTKKKYSVRYEYKPTPDDDESILKRIDSLNQEIASAKEQLSKPEPEDYIRNFIGNGWLIKKKIVPKIQKIDLIYVCKLLLNV